MKTYKNKRVSILQPFIPHYRVEFFQKLSELVSSLSIFSYESVEKAEKMGFNTSNFGSKVSSFSIKGVLFYSPFALIRHFDTIVLMLHFAHVTTWLLLLSKFIHRRKIILWGQGISVNRYLKEERRLDWRLKLMVSLADGVWLYTEKELSLWRNVFPTKKIISLNNSISGVADMLAYKSEGKVALKSKYGIIQDVILIFCARFESMYRRTDLLEKTIKTLDNKKYGFVIIGSGKYKPDFSKFINVYDFGAVYDDNLKSELFFLSDLYFQPGWVGLSIVEAMAYGLPVCTFKRTEITRQCVEYSYINHEYNGLIFDSVENCCQTITRLTKEDIANMGINAKKKVSETLTPTLMANSAIEII